jgi:hypothetical protein
MQQAIEALRAGDKDLAFVLLRRHLAMNPKDVTAWLWMSEAAPEPRMQIDALERVLRLAPEHPQAAVIHERLRVLREPPAQPEEALPAPEPAAPVAVPPPADPTTDELLAQLRGETLRAPQEGARIVPSPLADTSDEAPDFMGEAAVESPGEVTGTPAPAYTSSPASELDEMVRGLRGDVATPIRMDEDEAVGMVTDEEMDTPAPVTDGDVPASRRRGTPGWVWIVLLLFLLAVAVFLYIVFMSTQGTGFP